jgi:hypothetical protein
MIELTRENTTRAVERCRRLKPKVRFVQDRVFTVQSANNANVYTVRFDVRNGKKLAQCECAAAEKGLICYHVAGAAAANIYRQSLKRREART